MTRLFYWVKVWSQKNKPYLLKHSWGPLLRGHSVYVMQLGVGAGVSEFTEKSITKVYYSMLLALREGGWVLHSPEKVLRNTCQRPIHWQFYLSYPASKRTSANHWPVTLGTGVTGRERGTSTNRHAARSRTGSQSTVPSGDTCRTLAVTATFVQRPTWAYNKRDHGLQNDC